MTALADLPPTLTVEECAEVLRLGRSAMYAAVRAGEVPGVIRIGRTIRISRAALERWLGVPNEYEARGAESADLAKLADASGGHGPS